MMILTIIVGIVIIGIIVVIIDLITIVIIVVINIIVVIIAIVIAMTIIIILIIIIIVLLIIGNIIVIVIIVIIIINIGVIITMVTIVVIINLIIDIVIIINIKVIIGIIVANIVIIVVMSLARPTNHKKTYSREKRAARVCFDSAALWAPFFALVLAAAVSCPTLLAPRRFWIARSLVSCEGSSNHEKHSKVATSSYFTFVGSASCAFAMSCIMAFAAALPDKKESPCLYFKNNDSRMVTCCMKELSPALPTAGHKPAFKLFTKPWMVSN